MRILIAEDGFISRVLLAEILSPYADCDIATDGEEEIHAFELAWERGNPYDFICTDIVLPNLNGQQALERIREIETEMGLKEGPTS